MKIEAIGNLGGGVRKAEQFICQKAFLQRYAAEWIMETQCHTY